MAKPDAGATSDSRSNALWGTGNRGGNGQRSNALWGKSGRGALVMALAALVLVVPLAAAAGDGNGKGGDGAPGTWIYPGLLAQADQNPGQKVRVIIQSNKGTSDAEDAFKGANGDGAGSLTHRLGVVGAVSAEMPAARIKQLAKVPGLTVTPDAAAKVAGALFTSTQLWPGESGNSKLWADDGGKFAASQPAIAIVDSGIDASRPDIGSRIVANVNLSTLSNNSPGDGRGHGTFVAGIAAGSAPGYAGADPAAKIVSIDVMDDGGKGSTSDIINACQWILDHKGQYNIRVANFSLHSSLPSNFAKDPLDKAVEKLWFNGVTVVAAAGNYGVNGQATRVKYAPGNDPFVITVGAVDLGGTNGIGNDLSAPWSVYGYTYDGFQKPDVAAAGRYMVGPIPPTSTLAALKAANVTSPGYIQLSGTSFAAPVVSGTVAEMLVRHPSWTPDQVKGALMVTARPVPNAVKGSTGAGEITASKAADYGKTPANPNKALEQYVVPDPAGGSVFDGNAWLAAAKASPTSWDSASYADASYADASWDLASYADASWDLASYADASYADASYADASYADASYEDAAEGDATSDPNGYQLTPDDLTSIASDPTLAPPDGSLVVPGVATTTTTTTSTTSTTTALR